MSFNPHEILFRLRSQQNNTNSNASNTQEPLQGNNISQRGGEQKAQTNKINSASNQQNNINSHQRLDSNNFESRTDPYVQQPFQQQIQQNSFNQAQYNNMQLNSGNQQQRNQFMSISNNNTNANPKNNQRNNNHNSNSRDSLKHKAQLSNQFNLQQPQQFNGINNGEDFIQNLNTDPKGEVDPNNNNIVDYLLNKVSFLEKHVLEQQQKGPISNKSHISPSRKVKTEVMYEEVAEVINKEPVDKILQKKEKNFVPFASKNSKRYNQPKVAGKLNLEQLQRIINNYPSLSKPIINIKLSEADLN